jgi:hypothetical protein
MYSVYIVCYFLGAVARSAAEMVRWKMRGVNVLLGSELLVKVVVLV